MLIDISGSFLDAIVANKKKLEIYQNFQTHCDILIQLYYTNEPICMS